MKTNLGVEYYDGMEIFSQELTKLDDQNGGCGLMELENDPTITDAEYIISETAKTYGDTDGNSKRQ
jgi:hypothetical protein